MKKISMNKLPSVLVIGVMLISGCAKKESAEKPVYDVVPPAVVAQPAAGPASDNRLAYYEANLEKAKEVWNECQRIGPKGMSKNEQRDCSMARVAWHNRQPKAGK